jgi:hypothetical protein
VAEEKTQSEEDIKKHWDRGEIEGDNREKRRREERKRQNERYTRSKIQ